MLSLCRLKIKIFFNVCMYLFIYFFLEHSVKGAVLGQVVATGIFNSVKLETAISHLEG